MAMYQAGEHATAVLTKPLQDFVVAMGGTGATLVVCFMFAFLAKSKEMRAVGRASAVPVCFGVNELFLFGAPMVLNPIFFILFIFRAHRQYLDHQVLHRRLGYERLHVQPSLDHPPRPWASPWVWDFSPLRSCSSPSC